MEQYIVLIQLYVATSLLFAGLYTATFRFNLSVILQCADPEGGTGGKDPHPLEKSQNIGFLSNTGLDH